MSEVLQVKYYLIEVPGVSSLRFRVSRRHMSEPALEFRYF